MHKPLHAVECSMLEVVEASNQLGNVDILEMSPLTGIVADQGGSFEEEYFGLEKELRMVHCAGMVGKQVFVGVVSFLRLELQYFGLKRCLAGHVDFQICVS